MTVTVTVYPRGGLRWRGGFWMMLLLATTPALAQEQPALLIGTAIPQAEVPVLDSTLPSVSGECIVAAQTLPPQRITGEPPALPSQKLSAVVEPPPLPTLDALPLIDVDPNLDIVHVRPPAVLPDSLPEPIPAVASFYHASLSGNLTASGERYNPQALTAAHRTLPFGTRLRVTNMRNGKSVVVRVNDRGPFVKGRGLDLSRAAAELIGMVRRGVARVTVEALDAPVEVQ